VVSQVTVDNHDFVRCGTHSRMPSKAFRAFFNILFSAHVGGLGVTTKQRQTLTILVLNNQSTTKVDGSVPTPSTFAIISSGLVPPSKCPPRASVPPRTSQRAKLAHERQEPPQEVEAGQPNNVKRRALPTETRVENGTSQRNGGTSVNVNNSRKP